MKIFSSLFVTAMAGFLIYFMPLIVTNIATGSGGLGWQDLNQIINSKALGTLSKLLNAVGLQQADAVAQANTWLYISIGVSVAVGLIWIGVLISINHKSKA